MDEILFELQRHSSGLNCGMWDYTASIIVSFRHDRACLLPDRQQCVSMRSPFLTHYMELLIRTCRRRQTLATTGMVPFVLDALPPSLSREVAVEKAIAAKQFEALAGSDGALVFDLALVTPVQKVRACVCVSLSCLASGRWWRSHGAWGLGTTGLFESSREEQDPVPPCSSSRGGGRSFLRASAADAPDRFCPHAVGRFEPARYARVRARVVRWRRHCGRERVRGRLGDCRDLARAAVAVDASSCAAGRRRRGI